MNLFIALSLNFILQELSVLQIMCFSSMFGLNYPANALEIVDILLYIFNVEMLDPDIIYSFFGLDFEYENELMESQQLRGFFQKNFKNFGFETYNAILNLGGFVVMLFLYPIKFLFSMFIRFIVVKLYNWRQKDKKRAQDMGVPIPKRKFFKTFLKTIGRFQEKLMHGLKWNALILMSFSSVYQVAVALVLFFAAPPYMAPKLIQKVEDVLNRDERKLQLETALVEDLKFD